MAKLTDTEALRDVLRNAVADYIRSEGCSCCRNEKMHDEATRVLAGLLHVPMYDDGSGYDFNKFATDPVEIG
jgi:hypothetical protein